jgi:FMN phosphatase YigB (HAD superfamily)
MLTIVWDVDDVLNNLMGTWLEEAWRPAHPACTVAYSQLRANPPHEVLGVAKSEYLASLDAFRDSGRAHSLTPDPAILDWLTAHGQIYRHMALTARPLASAGSAADWVFRHFGNYIRCYGVVPSRLDPAAPQYDRDKAEFLRWFGEADFFVDDSEENVAAVRTLGVNGIVFPQPWNQAARTVEETLRLLTEQVVTR